MNNTEKNDSQVTLTIDDVNITVPKGTTVYQAARKLKVDIPVFCYQDRMPPFGACRVCLVEVEKMAKPQTSCTLEATDGMVVRTKSEPAVKAREDILEFLLINHPLDCPICDRGGECPLQEHTFHHGPGISRFFEEKRHFKKALPLGPLLMLDRERCIICARCTRFSDLISGDHALEMKERGFLSEVGTPNNQPVESKFIGNTISICPVGALTSQAYRFRARPWDNDSTPTTCTLCPVGCNMAFDSRDGEIMRTRSLEKKQVNDMWMCDKGFFGYQFNESKERLVTPLIRKNGVLVEASFEEALKLITEKIHGYKTNKKLAGLGGNVLTTEESYLFQELVREVFETSHVDHRVSSPCRNLNEEGLPPGMEISIGDLENAKTVVLLGLDVTEEFPVIWLRIKQGINKGSAVHFCGHYLPEISSYLKTAIAHAPHLEITHIKQLLDSLKVDAKIDLLVGRQYLDSPNRLEIIQLLQEFKKSHKNCSLNILEGSNNSMGARVAGMHPESLPLGKKTDAKGLSFKELMDQSSWDYLHIAGADPAGILANETWQSFRKNLNFLVVQDLFLTETAKQADVVLPTLSFVEKGGSFINIEGRISRLLPGKMLPENINSDEDIFKAIATKFSMDLILDKSFVCALDEDRFYLPIEKAKETVKDKTIDLNKWRVTFSKPLFSEKVRMLQNAQLAKNIKEGLARIHPDDAEELGVANGDALEISSNNHSIKVKVLLDPKVAKKTVVLPIGFFDIPLFELTNELINGFTVEVRRHT